MHGWGWAEILYRFGKEVKLDEAKISKIITALSPTWGLNEEEIHSYSQRVEKIVDLLRYTLPQSREEVIDLCEKHEIELLNGEIDRAKEVLIISRKDTKTFDFADMIYVPAVNSTMKLQKFKYVFVDEAQDLNKAQQAMVKKLVDPNGGRMIVVGDPNQAIYGFAGADANSFENLKNMFPNTVVLPLSFCYRCGSDIINHAQEIVPEILPAPNASKGSVRVGSVKEIEDGGYVICRNTRPLVSLCMKFISEGRKATIKGGDIGKNLINMVKNTKAKTHEAMFNRFEKDKKKLMEKVKTLYPLKDPEKVSSVVNLVDKIEALRSISNTCNTKNTEEIILVIQKIFKNQI